MIFAYMYKVDSTTANNLKEQFALAHKKYASPSEYREVKDIYGNWKENKYKLENIRNCYVNE